MCECSDCASKGYTYSEEWRHLTEARYVAALPNDVARAAYLEGVRSHRGVEAYRRLRSDARLLLKSSSAGA